MKKSALACLIGMCLTLALPVALADPIGAAERVRMERAIDVRVDSGQLMGAVLVASDGEPVIDKGYGLASVARKIADDPQTRFPIGSITKQLTAASILILEEEGKLKLDDPIKKYLADAPASWDRITILELLSQTAGIADLSSSSAHRAVDPAVSPAQLVARMRALPLDFAPGTSWHASSSSYVLLGYLIEKISGVSYGRFLREHIFAPLHMWNSGYDAGGTKVGREATGYMHTPDGPELAGPLDVSTLYSAEGVYSTTGDLLKWVQGLYGGKLLPPRLLARMITPDRNHCALGIKVERARNGTIFLTQGSEMAGFSSHLVYIPAQKIAVIVLANLAGGAADQLATDLREVADREPVTLVSDRVAMALTIPALERLTGHYWTDEGTFLAVTRQDRHLQTEGLGPTRELYARNAREFFARTEDVEVSFADDAEGRIDSLIFKLPDREVRAVRISDADVRALCAERDRKLQQQTASHGSATALRELISEVETGQLDASRLAPAFAQLLRRDLPRRQQALQRLGAVQQLEFMGVAPVTGEDVYLVTFAHATMQMRIGLGADGKIWSEELRPWQS